MTDHLVVLIDDLRSFRDGRPALVARTSAMGLELLKGLHGTPIAELWLDHDLGPLPEALPNGKSKDDIKPVVEELEEKAVYDDPYDIGTIYVHSMNGVEAGPITRGLQLRGYNAVRVLPGPHLVG